MVTTKRATAEELALLPDDGWRHELIEGVLVRMPPAGGEHGEAESEFVRHFGNLVVPAGLGRVYPGETGFFFGRNPDTVLMPDVAFVRADRLPPRRDRRGFLPVVPDLVVEIVSPSNRSAVIADKVARYLAAGVRLVWVAWPDHRAVEVHAPDRPVRMLNEGDMIDGEDVLPGFRLLVADVFT